MHRLKDVYKGDTAILIANGPSLKTVPASFFENHPTFGSNRIYLFMEPDYYAAIDDLVVMQNAADINKLHSVKFVREGMGVPGFQLHSIDNRSLFSYDIVQGVNEGFTISYVLLQIIYFMGFKTVLIVGMDHRYTYNGNRKSLQYFTHGDPNHFSPDYFRNQKWYAPSLYKMAESYRIAKEVYEKDGRRIVNLTPGSDLEVFERGDIKDWM